MPWCSSCQYEYVEGIAVCPECGTDLVAERERPAAEQGDTGPVEHDPPVLLTTLYDERDAVMLEALLRSEGIPVFKLYRGAGSYLKAYLGNTLSAIDLTVPASYEDRARELLELQNAPGEDDLPPGDEPEEEKRDERGGNRSQWMLVALVPFAFAVLAAAVVIVRNLLGL